MRKKKNRTSMGKSGRIALISHYAPAPCCVACVTTMNLTVWYRRVGPPFWRVSCLFSYLLVPNRLGHGSVDCADCGLSLHALVACCPSSAAAGSLPKCERRVLGLSRNKDSTATKEIRRGSKGLQNRSML
jgi:hypothetical protein